MSDYDGLNFGPVGVRPDQTDPSVAVVTIDRPEVRNALSHELITHLHTAIRTLDADRGIRAIILTGAGDRAFSAGADLHGPPRDAADVLRSLYNPLVISMLESRTPIIAAINGVAAGAAVSLALACDLRVAAENATFRLPFTGIGLVPDAGSTWLLPRVVGSARAADMALLGTAVDADTALDWGLVNRVAPQGESLSVALALGRMIAGLSDEVATTKQLLHGAHSRTLPQQLEAEASAQGRAHQRPHFQEARRAFAEKRRPNFGRTLVE